jgi:hypothetical protein
LSRRLLLAAVGLLVVVAAGATTLSSAAFSATSANPNSTFTADTVFPACPSAGTTTYTANRDAYVDRALPTTSFGSDASLRVRSRTSNRDTRAFVGFDLPNALPTGCVVKAATLTLTTTASAAGRTINVHRVNPAQTWSETVTWNSTANAVYSTAISRVTKVGETSQAFDVTTMVVAMYPSGNPDNGFLVKDAAEGQTTSGSEQNYRSREAASGRPTLTLTLGE